MGNLRAGTRPPVSIRGIVCMEVLNGMTERNEREMTMKNSKNSLQIAVEMIVIGGLSNNPDVRTALGMVIRGNGGIDEVFVSEGIADRAMDLLGEWAITLKREGYEDGAALLTKTRETALKRMAGEGGE